MTHECGGQFVYCCAMWLHEKIWSKTPISRVWFWVVSRKKTTICTFFEFEIVLCPTLVGWSAYTSILFIIFNIYLFQCVCLHKRALGPMGEGVDPSWPQGQGFNPQRVHVFFSFHLFYLFFIILFSILIYFLTHLFLLFWKNVKHGPHYFCL
jgi:hypothetical protein